MRATGPASPVARACWTDCHHRITDAVHDHAGSFADGRTQRVSRPTAVVRGDRQGLALRARGGTAGEDDVGSAEHQQSPARPEGDASPGDHCLVGKGRRPAAVGLRGSNPVRCCSAVRGCSGGPPVTCDPRSPSVTARARPGPAVPDAKRTQRGPGGPAPQRGPYSHA
jgi:hypothetical protein